MAFALHSKAYFLSVFMGMILNNIQTSLSNHGMAILYGLPCVSFRDCIMVKGELYAKP
jgi:hypothetical protein